MNNNLIVNVVDCMMGSGKTSAAINYINNSNEETKFIYITPYLEEVKRIKEQCKSKKFYEPQNYGTKKNGLKQDLTKGRNIVTTHALFQFFDDEIIELCYTQNYVLFMDEVANVIEKFKIDPVDSEVLLNEYVNIDNESGKLTWKDEKSNYSTYGVFYNAKKLCENDSLYVYNNTIMIWMFPIKVFRAFEETYILTYLFKAQMQKYYYDYYKIDYKYLYVDGDDVSNYHFTEDNHQTIKYNYKELINILDNKKLNKIGDNYYDLSFNWYRKNYNKPLMTILKNNLYNYFKMYTRKNGKSSNRIWTCYKDYKNELSGDGYSRSFINCSMRATNAYKNRQDIAYLVNRFYDPNISNFFSSKGIKVDEDNYALSEMIQFIWRSAIREGNPINIYIPSSRMRTILSNWIDEMYEKILRQ